MLRKSVIAILVAILLTSLMPYHTALAAPLDCGLWTDLPYKSGTTVRGYGHVSCASSHNFIRITVQVTDSAGRSYSRQTTCYSTDHCDYWSYLANYVSGRTYCTWVSTYVGDINWTAAGLASCKVL